MKYPPELQLLLLSTQVKPQPERLRNLAAAGVDWRAFLGLAQQFRVRPLVYENLTRFCWDFVPAEMQQEWQRHARALSHQALRVTGTLLKIINTFEKEHVPVVALKGPVLAQQVYGSITLREFDDVDLLVQEADFPKAQTILQRSGYRADWEADPATKLEFLRYQGESVFANPKGGPPVDLHWRVAVKNNALPLDVAYFWPRFRPLQVAGRKLLGFVPEDLALYLASQGAQDQWLDVRRLCDLAALIHSNPDLDWGSVIREASRLRGLRVLLLGLRLTEMLSEAGLPEVVRAEIRNDSKIPGLADKVLAKITAWSSPGEVQRSMFQIRVKERLWDKLCLTFGLLIGRTHLDGQFIMLPKILWPLYWVFRPLRRLMRTIRGRIARC